MKSRTDNNYCAYLAKVQKQVHPNLKIKKKTILALNNIIEDSIARIMNESAVVARASKKSTLSAKHVQAATRSLLPGELGKHAVSEGTKATTKFTS